MIDSFGRNIDYLRVSITDRCNLRCKYCMPEDLPGIAHDSILRYEEILRVIREASKLGIKTIKVTGGEPLVRRGCVDFIRELKDISGIEHVTLTTNGVLLEEHIDELARVKLDGVNISLDSLDREVYRRITGRDELEAALQSVYQAAEAGLKVKINAVPIRGINHGDILPITRLAEKLPVDVRFIELMPTEAGEKLERISGGEVLGALKIAYPDLAPSDSKRGFGPARYYRSGALLGSVGFISAIGDCFCAGCNRARLTSEGFLKPCLYHEIGLDLRSLLRGGAEDGELQSAIAKVLYNKPERHLFGVEKPDGGIKRMSRIGG